MAINYVYAAKSVSGGGVGALDNIDGNQLSNGDSAIVTQNTQILFFEVTSSGATEVIPYVVSPDSNAGIKRWHLCSVVSNDSTVMDDIRIGGRLFVEDNGVVYGGISTDATLTGGFRLEIKKGIITSFRHVVG